jgi:hypothetical protein
MNTAQGPFHLIACLAFSLLTALASAQTFTTIDYPGGFCTQPTAITPSGIIVGRYFKDPSCDPNGPMHGFVLASGKYVPVDVTGAVGTELNWINPSGQIVGDYHASDGKWHGFLLVGGKFTFFDYPGAFITNAFGINPSGDIVGAWAGVDMVRHGYLLSKQGALSSIDFSGASDTFAAMVNQKIVVGYWLEPIAPNVKVPHSFSFSAGKYQEITCPGWTLLVLSGLTPQGDMTGGGQRLADGTFHGLVVSGGKCTAVDFPGSVGNDYVNSMNPSGDSVGTYATPDFNSHGYLRTKR